VFVAPKQREGGRRILEAREGSALSTRGGSRADRLLSLRARPPANPGPGEDGDTPTALILLLPYEAGGFAAGTAAIVL